MGDDKIHRIVRIAQCFHRMHDLIIAGLLPLPPVVRIPADVKIAAVSAAKGKDPFALNLVNLATHQMIQIAADVMHLPSVPFGNVVFLQQVEISL